MTGPRAWLEPGSRLAGGTWLLLRRVGRGRWLALHSCGAESTVAAAREEGVGPRGCRGCLPGSRAGTVVGGRLILERARGERSSSAVRVRCLECGEESVLQNPAAVDPRARGCRACSWRLRRLPRACLDCGTREPRRFGRRLARTCMACDKRAYRNGRCPRCRLPRDRTRTCPCRTAGGNFPSDQAPGPAS